MKREAVIILHNSLLYVPFDGDKVLHFWKRLFFYVGYLTLGKLAETADIVTEKIITTSIFWRAYTCGFLTLGERRTYYL